MLFVLSGHLAIVHGTHEPTLNGLPDKVPLIAVHDGGNGNLQRPDPR
ncbi:hypothetical protein [Amycolatopsis ultiminotia]